MIPFNKPHFTGNEQKYIQQTFASGKISGVGLFTKKCQDFFEKRFGFKKVMLTTSCTDALEMAAILIAVKPGDEVILPSYTFVSTANAFLLRGAKVVFVDSCSDHPGMDENKIEEAITPKTKAIVAMHYAGVACDMDKIMKIASRHGLFVVEDAAQAIDSYYKNRPLGSIGHLAAFSFHQTKNIVSGEGGMLVLNDERLLERAEIIHQNGTDRSKFLRGEIEKYGWRDIGSSFFPSEMITAFLWAQLEKIDEIQTKRKEIWEKYDRAFRGRLDKTNRVQLPFLPEFSTNNAHIYYLVCTDENQRKELIAFLKNEKIQAVFHYVSLHKSEFYKKQNKKVKLQYCKRYDRCLVRLPLFYDLSEIDQKRIIETVLRFFENNKNV